MLKWLRKIFMTEDNTTNIEVQTLEKNETVQQQTATKKRFEVEIYDKILVGEPPNEAFNYQKVIYEKPVIIEAATKKDLDDFGAQLALCNQVFKVVRVLDDVPQQNKPQNDIQQNVQSNIVKNENVNRKPIEQQNRKPKFYKIGNFEIKDDNGKIYHKQWLKLTDEEMSNFRIVSNKNNAVVNLKDKSIEMKRWVLVENTDDTTSDLEKEIWYE